MTDNNISGASPSATDSRLYLPSSRHRPRSRRGIAIVCTLLGVLTVCSALWLAFTATKVHAELNAAVNLVPHLKSQILRDDSAAAGRTLGSLKKHTREAKHATSAPLWNMANGFPWIGQNFQAVSTIATSADDVAELAAEPLVSVSQSLEWEAVIPNPNGVQLGPLAAAEPKLISAAHAVRQSSERLKSIDADALMPQVSVPLVKAREELAALRSGLEVAASAATLAPDMLGASGPRKYLLLIQNNAEARATGGIPGALAVMKVDQGTLTLAEQTSATKLGAASPQIPVEVQQQQIFSERIGRFMQDVNLTPDFPTSARVAVDMWQQKTGERLDGVVSLDPVALSYLLKATGAVTLSSPDLQEFAGGSLPRTLDQTNVVSTLLSDVYSEIPEPVLQDLYFAGVAEGIFAALSSGKNDNGKLIQGISDGVEEGRVLIWSAVPAEQAIISNYSVSGSISGGNISPAQFGLYFNDGTGAKMDYYVKRTVQLFRGCPVDGYSQVKVKVKSTNTAPANAAASLPAYVTGAGAFGVPAGTVQTNIVAYGPVQSHVQAAVADGKKISFASQLHSGRPVGTVTVALPPGKSSTVEFTFGKIVQHTEPSLAVTPTVQARDDVVLDTVSEKCVPTS